MIRHEVKPGDVAAWLMENDEERRKRIVKAIQTCVSTEAPRLAQQETHAAKPVPVDRGQYLRGFVSYPTDHGSVFINHAPHAPIVEDGRRPGKFPPVDAIEAWVRRKFRVRFQEARRALAASRGRAQKARVIAPAKDVSVRSIAFLVGRAIARRGLPPHRIMARVEARLTPLVYKAIGKAARGEEV